jgi:hypothetical protein
MIQVASGRYASATETRFRSLGHSQRIELNTAVLELPVVGGDPVHHGAQFHHRVPAHDGAQQLRAARRADEAPPGVSWIADAVDLRMTEGEDIACIDVGLCQPPVSYGFVEESSGMAAVASSHGRQMVKTDDVGGSSQGFR